MPLKNSEQIVAIFCGTSGLLDDIELNQVREFEKGFVQYMNDNHADLMEMLDGWKTKWDDELAAKVEAAGEEFKKSFNA